MIDAHTIAMLRDQADHPNAEGWAELAPNVVRAIATTPEAAITSKPVKPCVGARVRWTSQSNGSRTTKTGTIHRVVAAGESVRDVPGLNQPGHPRPAESYLVRGDNGRLYWPRVSTLEVLP